MKRIFIGLMVEVETDGSIDSPDAIANHLDFSDVSGDDVVQVENFEVLEVSGM